MRQIATNDFGYSGEGEQEESLEQVHVASSATPLTLKQLEVLTCRHGRCAQTSET